MTEALINNLNSLEINPRIKARASVIWLHGLGADGHDFIDLIPALKLTDHHAIRFIFPHAPLMPVTLNNGYNMRAWFDIYELNINSKIDSKGIKNSVLKVNELIEQEVERGVKYEHIVLAGFSQGSVIAMNAGILYPHRLGGVIALSGYLPEAEKVFAARSEANRDLPFFLAHGRDDDVVSYALGKATYVALSTANYPVAWHSYPIQHTLSREEVSDISSWLQNILKDS